MNKKILISLAAISFIADIITLTSAFKWVLIKLFDINTNTATIINGIAFIVATIVLIGTLIYPFIFINRKLQEAGTHGIECAFIPYLRFKAKNKMNTLLRTLHCNLYHTIIDVKKHVNKQKRQRGPEEQGNPLPISEVKSQLLNLLDSFHITVQNGGTLVIDGGILANALINLSSSSHVRIVNGGTIYMRKNRYFSAPVGCVVEIENGEIRGPYIKKSAKWN